MRKKGKDQGREMKIKEELWQKENKHGLNNNARFSFSLLDVVIIEHLNSVIYKSHSLILLLVPEDEKPRVDTPM